MFSVDGSPSPAFDQAGRSVGWELYPAHVCVCGCTDTAWHSRFLAWGALGPITAQNQHGTAAAGEHNERCLLVSRPLCPEVFLSSKQARLFALLGL